MIEVTLALMVVSMGLLGILGMFTTGLDQSARGRDAATAALFAEEVFSGLRADSDWATYNWPWVAEDAWADPADITIGATVNTSVYRKVENPDIVHHALRYRLRTPSPPAYTNLADYFDTNLVKCAILEVWPGRFGAMEQKSVFYTEFFDFE